MSLCPTGCGQCPDVEMAGDEVRIGEAGNLAVLKKDEWNLLVDLIQSGQLTKVSRSQGVWARTSGGGSDPHHSCCLPFGFNLNDATS